MKLRLSVLLLCAPFLVGCRGLYVVSVLPDLGGMSGSARDINGRGDIVGYSVTPTGSVHAVLWRAGSIIDLGTLGGANSWAYGINDDGVIVGVSEIAGGRQHAFMWREGTMTDIHDPDLPPINESTARAINSSRAIVGTIGAGGAVWRTSGGIAWVLDGSGLTGPTDAHDINDTNQVVGWHHSSDEAFIWEDGMMTILPDLGFNRSRAFGINNAGKAVGTIVDPSVGQERAAMWEGRRPPVMLGTLGGTYSIAYEINDSDVVVGSARKPDDSLVPFYFEPSEGAMRELPSTGRGSAYAINNGGVMVGQVLDVAGEERPVKWYWERSRLRSR